MVMRHHEELRQKEEKAKRDEHAKIRRVASSIAKEVRAFWSSVEKVQMIPRNQANRTFCFSVQRPCLFGFMTEITSTFHMKRSPASKNVAV